MLCTKVSCCWTSRSCWGYDRTFALVRPRSSSCCGNVGVGIDVEENLFDAKVSFVGGCAIVEALEFFLGATKGPSPVTIAVD